MHMKRMQILLALLLALPLFTAGCAKAPQTPMAQPTATAEIIVASEPTGAQDAPATLPAPYADVIFQYADAMANGYYRNIAPEARDAAFGERVALEWRIDPKPAMYALCDLDGNGVDELCIGAGADVSEKVNYDIWCCADGQAVRPFDIDFGYRAQLSLYADGTIEITWSDSAFSSGYDFYQLHGTSAAHVAAMAIEADMQNSGELRYLVDGAAVDEAMFTQTLAAYESKQKAALDWIDIAVAD